MKKLNECILEQLIEVKETYFIQNGTFEFLTFWTFIQVPTSKTFKSSDKGTIFDVVLVFLSFYEQSSYESVPLKMFTYWSSFVEVDQFLAWHATSLICFERPFKVFPLSNRITINTCKQRFSFIFFNITNTKGVYLFIELVKLTFKR